jgi:hypothetical protein
LKRFDRVVSSGRRLSSILYSPSGFFSSYFINEVNFYRYKKYVSVGRLTIFGTYVFKSNPSNVNVLSPSALVSVFLFFAWNSVISEDVLGMVISLSMFSQGIIGWREGYKKYVSVGRLTIFGTYVFKSNLEYFWQMSRWSPVYVPGIETGRHVKNNAHTGPEGLYKIELCRLPLRHRLFLSCDCHGVTDRTCKQKSWLKCACFLYKIHVYFDFFISIKIIKSVETGIEYDKKLSRPLWI